MKDIKRYAVLLILPFVIILVSNFAFGLSITPSRIETPIPVGKSRTFEFTAINPKNYPIKAKIWATDWSMTKEGEIVTQLEGEAIDWLEIAFKEVEIEANNSKKIPFTVTLPEDFTGEYRAMLFFEEVSKKKIKKTISLATRIGTSVYVWSEGAEVVKGTLGEITISPQQIEAVFQNCGNVHLRPTIAVYLKDSEGEWIEDEEGKPIEIQITKGWPVLPQKEVVFKKEWKPNLKPGKYLAIVKAEFGSLYGKERKLIQKKELEFEI